ncbi:MAG: SulP family inorganic anion transporter [Rhodopila sp.]
MIGGTVAQMAGGAGVRYGEIAVDAAVIAGSLCLVAWMFRLSVLVKLISDSVLIGFKAGAGRADNCDHAAAGTARHRRRRS